MALLRIYDVKNGILAAELSGLLRLLAPRSLQASWIVRTVKSSRPGHEWFEATGEGGERLEKLAQDNEQLAGPELAALADDTLQVLWGEFVGSLSSRPGKAWVVIRAADSTFYEIETDDETVLKKIRSNYVDVRVDEAPITSWPL